MLNAGDLCLEQGSFVFSAMSVRSFVTWLLLVQMQIKKNGFVFRGNFTIEMKFWIAASANQAMKSELRGFEVWRLWRIAALSHDCENRVSRKWYDELHTWSRSIF